MLCSRHHLHEALSNLMNDEFTIQQTRSTWTAAGKFRPFCRSLLRPHNNSPKEFMESLQSVDKEVFDKEAPVILTPLKERLMSRGPYH